MKLPLFVGIGADAWNWLLNNLVSYYKCDTSWSFPDVHWSNNWTISGASYTSSWKINWAYDYDWTNDYVSMPSWTSVSWWTARTLSLWIKKWTSTWIETIYESWIQSPEKAFRLHHSVNEQNDIYISFNNNDYYTVWNTITNWVWHHISVVYDWWTLSTSTVHIYVDWVSKSLTMAWTWTWSANTSTWISYLWQDSSIRYFEWIIDEVWIWNTNKLQTDITALYNSGSWLSYNNFTT